MNSHPYAVVLNALLPPSDESPQGWPRDERDPSEVSGDAGWSAAPSVSSGLSSHQTSWRRLLLFCATLRRLGGQLPTPTRLVAIRSLLPLATGCAEESERDVQLYALLTLLTLVEVRTSSPNLGDTWQVAGGR